MSDQKSVDISMQRLHELLTQGMESLLCPEGITAEKAKAMSDMAQTRINAGTLELKHQHLALEYERGVSKSTGFIASIEEDDEAPRQVRQPNRMKVIGR